MKAEKILLILLCTFVVSMATAQAISIGVSPGRVNFEQVLRGGYAERTVTISTGGDEELLVTLNPNDPAKEWMGFEPNATSFVVSKNTPYKLTIIAAPPEDLSIGNYSGAVEILTEISGSGSGRAGASVKTAVTMLSSLEISGTQVVRCRAGGFGIGNFEVGSVLELGATIINDGNVRLTPSINVDVWDQLQQNIIFAKQGFGEMILPTTQKNVALRMSNDLGEGQYWANIMVDQCGNSNLITFSVVERGGIIDNGELVDIINRNPSVFTKETVQVVAKFSNNGQRSVTASFKGAIRLEDKIVKLIETDEQLVPAGQTTDFDIFFVPEVAGRYSLTGRVVYNKKLTFEKGTIINVSPAEGEEKKSYNWLPLLIYILISITIIFLIRKIRHEKLKKRRF